MEMWPIGKNKNIESNLRMTKWFSLGDKFQAIILIYSELKMFLTFRILWGKMFIPAEYNFSLETQNRSYHLRSKKMEDQEIL